MTDDYKLELEVEVPGTPEQVWEAIATGPGITAWFADTRIDGDTIVFDMGAGVSSTGTVTASEPPHRFAYEEPLDEGSRIASEQEIGGMSDGWQAYMENLRLYLTHWPAEPCSPFNVGGEGTGSLDAVWAELTGALGLEGPAVGDDVSTAGGPRLAGTVERRTGGGYHQELLLRLTEPAPGTAFVLVYGYQERLYPAIRAYLFGADAPAVAERERAAWQAWMDERFASRATA